MLAATIAVVSAFYTISHACKEGAVKLESHLTGVQTSLHGIDRRLKRIENNRKP